MKNLKFSVVFGYLLLSPAIISVCFFFKILFFGYHNLNEDYFSEQWTGNIGTGITHPNLVLEKTSYVGGGYTSALPIYIGLMAIAGAYLIKRKE